MEEPGRLQSMGSLGVGHDWVTSPSLFTFMHWRRKWQPNPGFLPGESQGWGSLVGCRLRGCRESHTTDATELQQQQQPAFLGFPGGSDGKEFSWKLGDLGPIPGLGRSPGEGKGHPLQYSCLKNPHGQRSLAGHSLCSCRVRDDWAAKPSTEWTSQVVLVVENPLPMQELEVQPLGWGDPQEEDTAT